MLNKKFLILRPKEHIYNSVKLIEKKGGIAIIIPSIKIIPTTDWSIVDIHIKNLFEGFYDWLIFTSPNGVDIVMRHILDINLNPKNIKSKIAVIGPSTLQKLKNYGLMADKIPSSFTGENLVEVLGDVKNLNILILRSSIGRKTIADILQLRGANVVDIPVYDVEIVDISKELEKIIYEIDYVLLTSSSVAKSFFSSIKVLPDHLKIACIGPITASTVILMGFRVDIVAKEHTFEGLIKEIEEYEKTSS
jgi:uroporphyrinogen-III synthase